MKKHYLLMIGMIATLALTACGDKNEEPIVEPAEVIDNVDEGLDGEGEFSVGMGNPWVETDQQGVLEATGLELSAPKEASDVYYSYLTTDGMAQVTYTMDGNEWTYRAQPTAAFEDISGMYYEWTSTASTSVAGREAEFMGLSAAVLGDSSEGDVQVINWCDMVAGVSYSLSVVGADLSDLDLVACAEAIYAPLQGDVTDDPEGDQVSELEEYFLGDFKRDYDESTLSIVDNGDGSYKVDISIVRLCALEDGIGTFENHQMSFSVIDPSGEEMQGVIYRDADNTLTIKIKDSTWEYLPNGELLEGFAR